MVSQRKTGFPVFQKNYFFQNHKEGSFLFKFSTKNAPRLPTFVVPPGTMVERSGAMMFRVKNRPFFSRTYASRNITIPRCARGNKSKQVQFVSWSLTHGLAENPCLTKGVPTSFDW